MGQRFRATHCPLTMPKPSAWSSRLSPPALHLLLSTTTMSHTPFPLEVSKMQHCCLPTALLLVGLHPTGSPLPLPVAPAPLPRFYLMPLSLLSLQWVPSLASAHSVIPTPAKCIWLWISCLLVRTQGLGYEQLGIGEFSEEMKGQGAKLPMAYRIMGKRQ